MHTDRKELLIARGAELRATVLQSKNALRTSLQPESIARQTFDRLKEKVPLAGMLQPGTSGTPVQLVKTILPLAASLGKFAAKGRFGKPMLVGTATLSLLGAFLAVKRSRKTQEHTAPNNIR